MAWETRRNGRRYYYCSVRIDCRVVKLYVGKGVLAEAFAKNNECYGGRARLKRKRRDRQREAEAKNEAMIAEFDKFCAFFGAWRKAHRRLSSGFQREIAKTAGPARCATFRAVRRFGEHPPAARITGGQRASRSL
jgi:hypothetical protein